MASKGEAQFQYEEKTDRSLRYDRMQKIQYGLHSSFSLLVFPDNVAKPSPLISDHHVTA